MSTVENNNNNFRCDICNKHYKDKSGLWYHNKKYHNDKLPTKTASTPPKSYSITPENDKITPELVVELSEKKNQCKYCNFCFTRKDSLTKHYNRCKKKKENDTLSEKTIKESEYNELKKENAEIKSILMELLKSSKIHPKTLQKINKNLISGNHNNVNNGTVNNINIVKFGSEDIKSILSEKEIKKILNCRYMAIEESIKHVHFNDNRPEYRNIYITNLRDDIAYVYNGNKFEAVQKHSVISELIDQHMNNIEVSLENYKAKLPEKTANILDKLLEKLQDEETKMTDENNNKEYKNYKSYKINDIKLMIYNETGKNTEVIKLKYNNNNNKKPKEIEV
jgi:hypothetical protein